jgi:ankyrin repeat protein
MRFALTTVTRAVQRTILGTALFLSAVVAGLSGAAMADARSDQALIASAGRGDAAAVRRLLDAGASVAARDGQGRTALLAATHAPPGVGTEAARLLIAAGADVNAKDGIEDTPYLYAAAEGRNDILKMTLAAGADLKSTNRYGGTGLIPAAHHGHLETVRILLGTAIDKDHINKLGWTALLEAVILGDGGPVHTDIVRVLVAAGANVNIADRDGVTPLGHARRRGYAAMTRILDGAGAR